MKLNEHTHDNLHKIDWIPENTILGSSLTENEKKDILHILNKYPNLYAKSDKDTGKTSVVTHEIDTGCENPVRKFPYRTSPKEKSIIAEEIKILNEKEIIRPSKSPW